MASLLIAFSLSAMCYHNMLLCFSDTWDNVLFGRHPSGVPNKRALFSSLPHNRFSSALHASASLLRCGRAQEGRGKEEKGASLGHNIGPQSPFFPYSDTFESQWKLGPNGTVESLREKSSALIGLQFPRALADNYGKITGENDTEVCL